MGDDTGNLGSDLLANQIEGIRGIALSNYEPRTSDEVCG